MQNSENNIDNLFQDKFADYRVVPSAEVWDKIEASLDEKKKKRRVFFIWGISSAASLLLAFLGGWYFANHLINAPEMAAVQITPSTVEKQIQPKNEPDIMNQRLVSQQTVAKNFSSVSAGKSSNVATVSNAVDESEVTPIRVGFLDRLLNPKNSLLLKTNDSDYSLVAMNSAGSDEDLSANDKAIIESNLAVFKEVKVDKKEGNWAVGVQASPAYRFNTSESADYASVGSSTLNQASSSQYVTNVMGGVKVEYNTGSRLSFQSGVSYGEIAQRTGKVGVTYSGHNLFSSVLSQSVAYDNTKELIEPTNSSSNVTLSTNIGLANIILPVGTQVAPANSSNYFGSADFQNYDFDQRAGYVEVPLIARYNLIEQRMGLYVLGGVNTNFLVSNAVALGNEEEVVATGQIVGLSPITFSSSLGLGFRYAITQQFNFSLEPMFKIQLTALNNQATYSTKPYTVGVFTGLSYNF
jgi:hypothetical protein